MRTKVYLDTSVISALHDTTIDVSVLDDIDKIIDFFKKGIIGLCISDKDKEEIAKIPKEVKKKQQQMILKFFDLIPSVNFIKFVPAMFGAMVFGGATFGGGAYHEDQLFLELKKIFDRDDAEHIYISLLKMIYLISSQ